VGQTLCLNMIVKNETAVLLRCLASVRPFIHSWVIVDTGSTDGTQELIRRELADLPGELHERPWRDFGTNRSEALELAHGKADYLLIMDADEVLEVPPGFEMPELSADMYMIQHRHGHSPELSWHLGTLVAALEHEPENSRYLFYLAQSLKDSNQFERAIEVYEERAALGGWGEEVYYSLLMVASQGNKAGWEWSRQLDAYLRAHQARPTRAEALCYCAMHYRFTQEWALAELFARAAVTISRPPDVLFVDESVYAWRSLDELSIATYYTGKRVESRALTVRLLEENRMPEAERPRIEANLAYTSDLATP
jgi:glycosyltransferase involved in cell wall biosynthesis